MVDWRSEIRWRVLMRWEEKAFWKKRKRNSQEREEGRVSGKGEKREGEREGRERDEP